MDYKYVNINEILLKLFGNISFFADNFTALLRRKK